MNEELLNKIKEVAKNYNLDPDYFDKETEMIYRNLLRALNDKPSESLDELISQEVDEFYNNN
jgi:hypothetical protein